MTAPADIDGLSLEALKALVVQLLSKLADQERLLAELREENARLKGLNGRPRIKPSGMEDASEPKRSAKRGKHRRRGKIVPRVAIEDRVIKAQVPPGSRFKGYESFVVQDIVLSRMLPSSDQTAAPGRLPSECLAGFNRNRWLVSIGIDGWLRRNPHSAPGEVAAGCLRGCTMRVARLGAMDVQTALFSPARSGVRRRARRAALRRRLQKNAAKSPRGAASLVYLPSAISENTGSLRLGRIASAGSE